MMRARSLRAVVARRGVSCGLLFAITIAAGCSGGSDVPPSANPAAPVTAVDASVDSNVLADAGSNDSVAANGLRPGRAFALDNGVDNPKVDGLAVRLGWSGLEPQEGTYDFTRLDTVLAAVKAQNKKATLHVAATEFQGATPTWLEAAGAKFYTYSFRGRPPTKEPVPWDPVYLAKWSAFLPKLAEHLKASGYLALVENASIAVPEPEMNLVGCANGMLDGASVPFDRSQYLAAWKQMVDLYHSVLPTVNKLVSAPQNGICGLDNDKEFYRNLMDYALAKDAPRFWLFAADLSAKGSDRVQTYADYEGKASIGFQPVAAFTSDPNHWVKGSLLDLYCSGLKMGAVYFEVYSADLANQDPAVQQAISAIHTPTSCN